MSDQKVDLNDLFHGASHSSSENIPRKVPGKKLSFFWKFYLIYACLFDVGGAVAMGLDLVSGLLVVACWPIPLLQYTVYFISLGGFFDSWGTPLTTGQSLLIVIFWYCPFVFLLGREIWVLYRRNRSDPQT